MNEVNTPHIGSTLKKYGLQDMPEAHNYLRVKGSIVDCTRKGSNQDNFVNDLITELEINPNQIRHFKVDYHKNYIKNYLLAHPEIPFNEEEFWKIREECISALHS